MSDHGLHGLNDPTGASSPGDGTTAPPPAPPGPPAPPAAPAAFGFHDEPYTDPDDDLGLERAGGAASPLEELVADLTENAEDGAGEVPIAVPTRRAIVIVQHDNITGRQIEEWRRQSKTRGSVDPIKFAAIILARTSVRLERNGEPVQDPNTGELATLRSEWLWNLYGAPGAVEAIRRLFGKDGYVNAAAAEVMAAAGWGSELAGDPT